MELRMLQQNLIIVESRHTPPQPPSNSSFKFCVGDSGLCEQCGAPYISGDVQRCPCPIRNRKKTSYQKTLDIPDNRVLPENIVVDTLLREGTEYTIQSLRPKCQHLGDRTDKRVKEKCQNSAGYLPVYRCELHRLCSPLGNCSDSDLIHPCVNCPDYAKTLNNPPK